ncbi:hypothetical protein ABXK66_19420, partial [Yersinia enterocolitica]
LERPFHYPWRGRFTLLPVFTLQYRVVEVCQQSDILFLFNGYYLKLIVIIYIATYIKHTKPPAIK